jgi:hypothetical protein
VEFELRPVGFVPTFDPYRLVEPEATTEPWLDRICHPLLEFVEVPLLAELHFVPLIELAAIELVEPALVLPTVLLPLVPDLLVPATLVALVPEELVPEVLVPEPLVVELIVPELLVAVLLAPETLVGELVFPRPDVELPDAFVVPLESLLFPELEALLLELPADDPVLELPPFANGLVAMLPVVLAVVFA